MAVDRSGNVVVTGSSYNQSPFAGGNSDYYTAKYAAADGTLLWEKRYHGPTNGDDFVNTSHSLALGPNGIVAVTGSSNGDFATVVYREVPAISIDVTPTGVRLRFTGETGITYRIQRALAATGPWETLATSRAPASSFIEYLDVNPPPGQAFYRTAQP